MNDIENEIFQWVKENYWSLKPLITKQGECAGIDTPGVCARCYYQSLQKSNEFNSRFKKSQDDLKKYMQK